MNAQHFHTREAWLAACKAQFPNGAVIGNGYYVVDVIIGDYHKGLGQPGFIMGLPVIARALAKAINTGTHYTQMQRSTVSMTLSAVLQRLGAYGVDKAAQEGQA